MASFNLVVQTAFIGDLILTIPLLKNIKSLQPDIPLVLLCRQGLGSFFLEKKLVDEVVEVTKKPVSNWSEVEQQLRGREFEIIVSPHQSFRSAFLVWRLKAKEKIGYWQWWNGLIFNKRVPRPLQWPEVLRQMVLIRHLSKEIHQELTKAQACSWLEPEKSGPIPDLFSLRLDPEVLQREKLVFLAPGSEWATKRWPPEKFAEVGNHFRTRGYKIIVTGSASEVDICHQVATMIEGSQNMAGQTSISQLYELFRTGSLLVTNDSGASHLASCAGLPVVAIFGPTVPAFGYRPWQNQARIVQNPVFCQPCSRHGSAICPRGTHECMVGLIPAKVLQKAQELGV